MHSIPFSNTPILHYSRSPAGRTLFEPKKTGHFRAANRRFWTSVVRRDVQGYKAKKERKGAARLSDKGFTLIELMVTVAIMMTLSAIAMSTYSGFIKKTKIITAINEIKTIAREIDLYREDNNGTNPPSLDDIGRGSLLDPWGNPYQYVNFETEPKGKWRRDKNMNPINTYYDLWSNGPDGKFQKQVSTPKSLDDIIRARDGQFVDVAEKF